MKHFEVPLVNNNTAEVHSDIMKGVSRVPTSQRWIEHCLVGWAG